jgi:D-lactate dehydrogenase (cytochrome)
MTPQPARTDPGRDRDATRTAIAALKQRFGDRLSTSPAMCRQHGHTTTWIATQAPDAVVFATTTDEVVDIVKTCATHRVPIIAFGAGTSLEGQVNAPHGGISVDLSLMNQVLKVNSRDLDCVVQPGVKRKQLNDYLRDTGLFFPIDPGADASIGGMAATRASGTNAVRYGTMKDNVLALKAVMPDGSILKTSSRARKSAAGYDLTRLLVGSEGTLGIVTEITLRLHGIPEATLGGVCPFPTIEDACNAVIATIQCGIPVARMELLDALQIRACNAYSKLELDEVPTLFLEFHGSEAGVTEQSRLFRDIAADNNGGEFAWATRAEDRSRLWAARHDAYFATLALRPGAQSISTDVCVPISRLAECVLQTQQDVADFGLIAPIVGHVGEGNFHCCPLVDVNDAEEMGRCKAFVERLSRRAIEMDGTCSGEHGVGQGKMKYMEAEHGYGVEVMRAIKRAIDPDNIMNPDKII